MEVKGEGLHPTMKIQWPKLVPEQNQIDAMKCIKTGLSVFFFIEDITTAIAYNY